MPLEPPLKLTSVHSYKGGVGKTTVATLLALAMPEDLRVCMVDMDLLAPGVHHLLGVSAEDPVILDYLVGDLADASIAARAEEVCRLVQSPIAGARPLYLVPGRADFERSELVQGYLLADVHSGVVRVYLEKMLQEVRQAHGIDLFVIDTPPSLLGASGVVRALVQEYGGATVQVCTNTWQDAEGTLKLLQRDDVRRDGAKKGGPPPEAPKRHAFVMNRCPEKELPTVEQQVCRVLADSLRFDRAQEPSLAGMLSHYRVSRIPDTLAIRNLSRPLEGSASRPGVAQLLSREIRSLASDLLRATEGGAGA